MRRSLLVSGNHENKLSQIAKSEDPQAQDASIEIDMAEEEANLSLGEEQRKVSQTYLKHSLHFLKIESPSSNSRASSLFLP